MKRRLISLLLVLALVLSLAPMAMAVEDPMKETYIYTDSRGNEVEVPVNAFATRVVSFSWGEKWTKDPDHMTPENILGTPEGENLCLGKKGQIVLEFSVDIVDNEGLDIYVFEVGPDVEPTSVEVSVDGSEWIYVGDADGSLSGVDLNGVTPKGARYHYVRITDLGKFGNSNHPGADIVAVAGLNVKANPFKDLPPDVYYYGPVTWAYDNEITNGVGDDKFDPNASCKRQDVVTYLWRLNGKPEATIAPDEIPFTDVNLDAYYGDALLWAYENEVVTGKTQTLFAPEDQIKRCEFVSLLYRNIGKPAVSVDDPFVDLDQDQYYVDAVLWAYENSITKGVDETHFAPYDNCTRAQVVTFLYRFNQLEKPEEPEQEEPEISVPEEPADDLLEYMYQGIVQLVDQLEGFEQGDNGYSDGILTIRGSDWADETDHVAYLHLSGEYPLPLAGLKVGIPVDLAKETLAVHGWTPVDSTQVEWDNGEGIIVALSGEDVLAGITAFAY